MDSEAFERLDAESKRTKQTRSELAKRLLEEGLRMEAHPGIVFRTGITGRHAALADGPHVWEIVMDFKGWQDEKHPAKKRVGASSLYPHQIRRALSYYADFPDEIDDRIKRNEDEAARSYGAWLEEQQKTAVR